MPASLCQARVKSTRLPLVPIPGCWGATAVTWSSFSGYLAANFSLEEVVRRMTSFAAERLGLKEMGRIAEGQWADLVLFDPETVADNTTLERPDAPPTGIRSVLISGQLVAQDGQMVSRERCGRMLRR